MGVVLGLAMPAAAADCAGDPANPNISGASGNVIASGGSCIHVEVTGSVTGVVQADGGYSIRIDGTVDRATGAAVLDLGSGASVVNTGVITASTDSGSRLATVAM